MLRQKREGTTDGESEDQDTLLASDSPNEVTTNTHSGAAMAGDDAAAAGLGFMQLLPQQQQLIQQGHQVVLVSTANGHSVPMVQTSLGMVPGMMDGQQQLTMQEQQLQITSPLLAA